MNIDCCEWIWWAVGAHSVLSAPRWHLCVALPHWVSASLLQFLPNGSRIQTGTALHNCQAGVIPQPAASGIQSLRGQVGHHQTCFWSLLFLDWIAHTGDFNLTREKCCCNIKAQLFTKPHKLCYRKSKITRCYCSGDVA